MDKQNVCCEKLLDQQIEEMQHDDKYDLFTYENESMLQVVRKEKEYQEVKYVPVEEIEKQHQKQNSAIKVLKYKNELEASGIVY